MLTDLDGSYLNDYLEYFIDYRINDEDNTCLNAYLITGENLTKLANMEDVYFIWGVFSAIEKNEVVDLDTIKEESYADGNSKFWVKKPVIQYPLAVAGLVLWNSPLILLLSKDNDLSNNFRNTFKGWKDPDIYNQS